MRVAVVAGPDPGHLFPAASLAMALRDRGHAVLVCSGGPRLARLRRDGLAAVQLPDLAPHPRDANFGFRLWGRGAQMAPGTAQLIADFGADVVVSDTLTLAGAFGAGLVGVRWVELVPHPLVDPSRALPPWGTALAPGRGPLGRGRDAVLRRLAEPGWRRGRAQRIAARRSLGLPAEGPPAVRLIATLPALEWPRPDWPADAEVVGPLVDWDPAEVDLVPPAGPEPLVLLSESTASVGARGLLTAALAGLRGVRLVSTRLEPYPDPLPRWARVGPGRQAPLLDAAAVVVTGGGHGMISKALRAGVPLVIVPGGGDQRDLAFRVRRLGAAVVVPRRRLGPATLAAAVTRVLADPAYAAAARRAAASGAGLGPAQAAELVESSWDGQPAPPR
jgi:UDP:flavonoid glycosyltransferase YjiC (YdhE family)